jgi:hypothetical protein
MPCALPRSRELQDAYSEQLRQANASTRRVARSGRGPLEFERRDDAFSDIDLEVSPLDVGGEYACVEWRVSMTHTGQIEVAAGKVVDPTGVRVTLHGITVAEFRGDRICSLRQYWDELSVFDQLGLLREGALR